MIFVKIGRLLVLFGFLHQSFSNMSENEQAWRIVKQMYGADAFSQWLGIEIVDLQPGAAILRLRIRREMLNGFGIAHGAITFALADSALAFASNGRGRQAVSIETSISHAHSLVEGDRIEARAEEEYAGGRIAHYRIPVYREADGALAAVFRGTVYLKNKHWGH